MRYIALLVLICTSFPGYGAIDAYPFPNAELQVRYNALVDELRCPQCLNTNLAGSDAMIAKNLRREVHRLLLEGKSDDQILDFMYERYGDFILYKPRLKQGTLVLWFGPLLLLLAALVVMYRVVVSKRANSRVLSSDEIERLDQLVGKK